jgi:farnesyl-diphosphate farnesyltransferase
MADFEQLLVRTSRTFALAIPLLPDPLRSEVATAYMLFRVADTFEDATRWPRSRRIEALSDFAALLQAPSAEEASRLARAWVAARPVEHDGYLELLGEVPAVIAALDAYGPTPRDAIVRHTVRTAEGMAGWVASGDEQGNLRLATLGDLRRYCYTVAGIVGELLTELFVHGAPSLAPAEAALWADAALFGEGLQLVNILKDAGDDARDGRVYLPPDTSRAAVLALARDDLRAASRYVLNLQTHGAPAGYLRFTALPVLLARATLDRLEEAGAGAKLRRDEVFGWMTKLDRDLASGAPALAEACGPR